jgi:type I restriction enzyme R subunit
MKFNEDSRVKIPTILHLMRLGYEYLPLKKANWDASTNIFSDIFKSSIGSINPKLSDKEIENVLAEISLSLENEDLGRAFYEKLVAKSGIKLIDFENFDNNSFYVVTELPCKKDDEEFRPDITLLINGMPLAFIEVKKPNNLDGIQDEYKRMEARFQNKKFRKFINITQLMVFSNNMEYDDAAAAPLQGAFYASSSYHKPIFNYFREETSLDLSTLLKYENDAEENVVLQDNNLISIKGQAEFLSNKNPDSPTNRICTSLFQKERLAFVLQYAIAYVKNYKGLQKHIMRYPQIFATQAITKKLEEGVKKGIIWHTQGSGKTALAYYSVKYLTDYFQTKSVLPKFYFIVDRIDLLTQASREFLARGLVVHQIDSREDFARDIKVTRIIHNDSGKAEITVVNIQKFQDDPRVIKNKDYKVDIQRVYFMDEVHRSYNPKGSFLANLQESDPNAIKIGLTGTPLLGDDYNSRSLFGDYIHKYYYNDSIADGYTLRLIREDIETSYKLSLQEILKEIEILKNDGDKKFVYAHKKFVEPMLQYIVDDFERSCIAMNDDSIGAMVVCDSSEQAKQMYEIFQQSYAVKDEEVVEDYSMVAEKSSAYLTPCSEKKNKRVSLILHDVGTKEDRKNWVGDFKAGKTDFLFVYNMLLTGFDVPRLKKLYVGRVIKAHNLLQALTRVNRTYKEFKFGYVVDFAGIEKQFNKTSQEYFNELQGELGDELQSYSELFLTEDEISQQIEHVKNTLFHFDTTNAEIFSQQINQISDRSQILEITQALNNAKNLYNLIRVSGNYELLEQLDFQKLMLLAREANNHLALINAKEALENNTDTTNLLNVALEDIIFNFTKIGEEEMILADTLRNTLKNTREMLSGNFDPQDPEFITLKEELRRLFDKKNLSEVEQINEKFDELNVIYDKAKELERQNQLLKAKYANDKKYVRLHKRLMEKNPLTESEAKLFSVLSGLKQQIDITIQQNTNMMNNESLFEKKIIQFVVREFQEQEVEIATTQIKQINAMLVKEYRQEYQEAFA